MTSDRGKPKISFPAANVDAAYDVYSFLWLAIDTIDRLYGNGYAMKNPALAIAMINATQIEFNRSQADQSKQSGTSPPTGGAS
jgi:hypothetical protein